MQGSAKAELDERHTQGDQYLVALNSAGDLVRQAKAVAFICILWINLPANMRTDVLEERSIAAERLLVIDQYILTTPALSQPCCAIKLEDTRS